MSRKINVLAIGPVSYIGGINVHMARLSSLLSDRVVFDFIDDAPPQIATNSFTNIRKPTSIPYFLRSVWQCDIVHIHCGNWFLRIFLVLIARFLQAKTVVTIHSYRLTGLRKVLSDFVMRLANEVVCVSLDIKTSLGRDEALVKEAFIPPVDARLKELPGEVCDFLERHDGSVVICANAYRLTRYEGKDLYGLDQCLEVARQARIAGDNFIIIFVVGTVMPNDDLYYSAQQKIADERLNDFIYIYPRSLDFLTLIHRSDIVLRPTVTDGDALTIREALFFGKPVIASDVVTRPRGTVTYNSENTDSLYDVIRNVASVVSSGRKSPDELSVCSITEYKEFYLKIYKRCVD